MSDLFSYTEAWSCKDKGNQLHSHVRYTYMLKSFILLWFLPFDILYIILFRLFKGKVNPGYIFTTSKVLNQCSQIVKYKSNRVFLVSDPITYLRHKKKSIIYIPASPIYILCGILPWKGRYRKISNKLITKFTRFLLYQIFTPGRLIFVFHSDALPFARSFIFSMQSNRIYSLIIVVVQHGIFHEHFDCKEIEGSFANVNVTRSEFDKQLIEKNNKSSLFIVSKNFFLPNVSDGSIENKSVILVGEGLHVLDKRLSEKYILLLKIIEQDLLNNGWKVKFRPHPSEKFIYRSFGFMNIDTTSLDISFSTALAYIGYSSTLLVEACSLGIPCYAVKIAGEADVNLQRFPGASEIHDFKISSFNPNGETSMSNTDVNLLREIAQNEVFSKIEKVYCV
jgi:hypothetical protein